MSWEARSVMRSWFSKRCFIAFVSASTPRGAAVYFPSTQELNCRHTVTDMHAAPPGTAQQRFLPKFHYELLACGVRGHVLVGTDAAEIRVLDGAFVRESGGLRWYRCLRCDSWVPLPAPAHPTRRHLA